MAYNTSYRRPAKINFSSRPTFTNNSKSGRVMYVGDQHQAIYGFSGSNSESMSVFADELSHSPLGLTKLPLTVTRRCPILVTALARAIVPTFECLPTAKVGTVCMGVSKLKYVPTEDNWYNFEFEKYPDEEVTLHNFLDDVEAHECNEGCSSYTVPGMCQDTQPKPGDMVLCRVNAPLIQMAYGMIRENKPVKIQGKDLADKIENKIKSLVSRDASTTTLLDRLAGFEIKQRNSLAKQYGEGTPRFDEALARLQDELTCIKYLCEGLATVQEVYSRIQVLFAEVKKGNADNFTLLSSIHKAKGLEAHTVRIIEPDLLPHPMAKLPWQKEQEMNLKYVAITRSTERLCIH